MRLLISLSLLAWFLSFSFCAQIASAESVTFAGKVSRHSSSDWTVPVRGTVHIRFSWPRDSGGDTDVVVPFFLPAEQEAVAYSQTVPWALADSGTSEAFGFFRVEVSCTDNCAEAGLDERLIYSTTSNQSGLARVSARHFGEEQRRADYIVDLTLLPLGGSIRGRLKLPNGKVAREDIDLFVTALDYGGCCYDEWLNVYSHPVRIPKGQSSVPFNFKLTADDFPRPFTRNRYRPSYTVIGYICESASCRDHGLFERGWLNADRSDVVYSDLVLAEQLHGQFMVAETNYDISLPVPIILREKSSESIDIKIVRDPNDLVMIEPIRGRIIVEKSKVQTMCSGLYNNGVNSRLVHSTGLYSCYFPHVGRVLEVVSETNFEIAPGADFSVLTVAADWMQQPESRPASNYQDYDSAERDELRIRYECDAGCENFPYAKTGYYSGEQSKYVERSASSAPFFINSSEFDNRTFNVTLLRPFALSPIIDMILEEKGEPTPMH